MLAGLPLAVLYETIKQDLSHVTAACACQRKIHHTKLYIRGEGSSWLHSTRRKKNKKKNSPLIWWSLIVMQEQKGKRHLNGGSCYPEHMGIVRQWVQRSHLCGVQWGLGGSGSVCNQMYRLTLVYLGTCWDCSGSCLKSTANILLSCLKCLFHNKSQQEVLTILNHQTFY